MEEGFRNLRKNEEAEKILKELVSKFPQDVVRFEGYLRLGLLYLEQKRFSEAISAFSMSVQSPEERISALAQFKLGEAYLDQGNRESAILHFSKVVYLYPHQNELMEESLLKLGDLYLRINDISRQSGPIRNCWRKAEERQGEKRPKRDFFRLNRG